MPRNISFAATIDQFKAGTKTVTRRLGWATLKVGTVLMAVEKSQGLKKGEKIERLGLIRVTDVRRERLDTMARVGGGWHECDLEGFPNKSPDEFVRMFCLLNECQPEAIITRIEFERIDAE